MKAIEIHVDLPCQVDYAGGVYTGRVVRASPSNTRESRLRGTRMFDVKLDRNGAVVRCAPRQIHRLAEPTPKVATGAAKPVKCAMCVSTEIVGLCDVGGTTPDPKPACQRHADPTLATPVKPAVPVVTSAEALEHMLEAQRGKTLRNARELLGEVQRLVTQLEAGAIPSGLNVSTVGFLLTDHAQLITFRDALEAVQDCEGKKP